MINTLENTQLLRLVRVHDDFKEIGNLLWSKEVLGIVEFNRSDPYQTVAQKVADTFKLAKGLDSFTYDQL